MYLTNKSRLRKAEVKGSYDIRLIEEALEKDYIVVISCYQETGGEDVAISFAASLNTEDLEEAFGVSRILKTKQERTWNELILPKPFDSYSTKNK
jgi:hypothetical protein